MRRLQITDLLSLAPSHAFNGTPYTKHQAALHGFGNLLKHYGGRLSAEQVRNIAVQLPELYFFKCGYMAVLSTGKANISMDDASNTRYIALNIQSSYIFQFIYDVMGLIEGKNFEAFQIEIPIADVMLATVLLSIPRSQRELYDILIKQANSIPEDAHLPAIEGFSDGHIILDFPLACAKFRRLLQ